MQDQINELKIAMATQQTIEAERWTQVTNLLKEMKDNMSRQHEEIAQLKTTLAQGSGAIKLVMVAGTLVALLIGLSKLLTGHAG